ncbi:hypothetical protein HMSSN139_07550 [Paenibacillus sp. HMSSN-139]|nr:hypothetical protein HMSSN139_07550 [Paenibacillus sp. HMSSN-139]
MLQSTVYILTAQGPNRWFMNSIAFWGFVLLGMMAIGGFFMFRKFLKVLPKADGMSKLDWQNHWVEQSRHLWTDEAKAFLDRLVEPRAGPVPGYRQAFDRRGDRQIALQEKASEVTQEHCIRGYIVATPKRDNKFLVKFLEKNQIDYRPYRHLMNK